MKEEPKFRNEQLWFIYSSWKIYNSRACVHTWKNIFGLKFNASADTISSFTLHLCVLWFHHSASSCSLQSGICWAHHQIAVGQPHPITWWLPCAIHRPAGSLWWLPPLRCMNRPWGFLDSSFSCRDLSQINNLQNCSRLWSEHKEKKYSFALFKILYQMKTCFNGQLTRLRRFRSIPTSSADSVCDLLNLFHIAIPQLKNWKISCFKMMRGENPSRIVTQSAIMVRGNLQTHTQWYFISKSNFCFRRIYRPCSSRLISFIPYD